MVLITELVTAESLLLMSAEGEDSSGRVSGLWCGFDEILFGQNNNVPASYQETVKSAKGV